MSSVRQSFLEEGVDYNQVQKIGQFLLRLQSSAALTYILPTLKLPLPYDAIWTINHYAVNGLIVDTTRHLFTKANPCAAVQASGAGNFRYGLLKFASTQTAALIAQMVLGDIIGDTMKIILVKSNPDAVENSLTYLWQDNTLKIPFMGLIGYGLNQTIVSLGMKMWEQVIPSQDEPFSPQKCYLVQTVGRYLLRLVDDLCTAEMALFYLNFANVQLNSHQQITLFLLTDITKQLGHYFSYTPDPIESLVPLHKRIKTINREADDTNTEDGITLQPPTIMQEIKGAAYWGTVNAAVPIAAYVISEMTCLITGACEASGHTLNRVARFGIALAIPLAVDFTIRHVIPQARKFYATGFSFFKKSPNTQREQAEQRELLIRG